MTTKRYLLCPGLARSQSDGQLHMVGARSLAVLYGVAMDECLILPDANSLETEIRRRDMLKRAETFELVELRPRDDGRYLLPSIDTRCQDAAKVINNHIARVAGQQLRRMRESWRVAK